MADETGFTFDPSNLEDIEGLDEAFIEAIESEAARVGFFLVGRARKNTPIKSGDLRASIQSRIVSRGDVVEVALEATEDYALRMHEELTPFGHLNLGPGSQAAAQEPVAEGGPGGKFLARVVDFNIKKIQQDLGAALEGKIAGSIKSNRPGFNPAAFFAPERFEGADPPA